MVVREIALNVANEAMKRNGLSALVATSQGSSLYTAGTALLTQRIGGKRLAIVALFPDDEPIFIHEGHIEAPMAQDSWIRDLRGYREFVQQPIDVLADVLREKRADSGRVGVEKLFLSANQYLALSRACPTAQFVEADAIFQRMRAVKTAEEVANVGRAAVDTDAAIRTTLGASRLGDTETTIGERLWKEARSRGALPNPIGASRYSHLIVAAGANTFKTHHEPEDFAVAPGALVRIDFGIVSEHEPTAVARTAIARPSSRAQVDTYVRLEATFQTLLTAVKPGIRARDLYELCKRECVRMKLDFNSPHCGHALSTNLENRYESPVLQPLDESLLEAGMMLALEIVIRGNDGRYQIKDVVEVTRVGNRVWSRSADWSQPFVIGG